MCYHKSQCLDYKIDDYAMGFITPGGKCELALPVLSLIWRH